MKVLILITLLTASLSHFFQKCQEEDMIFYKYSLLLDRLPDYLAAPLGACVYCNGTWVYIITYLIYGIFISPTELIILAFFGFLGLGLNYVWIEILNKVIK